MTTVLDWNPTVDPAVCLPPLKEALGAGLVSIVPGDVGYVALVNPDAGTAPAHLQALAEIADVPPAILAFGPEGPPRFGLTVPTAARRLMSRAWPAPLTVGFRAGWGTITVDWSNAVRAAVGAGGVVRFRCPDHPIFDPLGAALTNPTLVVETFLPTAAAAIERLGDSVGFAVSAGPRPVAGRPTEIRVNPNGWELIQAGVFAAEEIDKLAARIILFVCTGNTCRSPLAEGLAKKLLADHLKCGLDELPARGFWVISAGVSAYPGGPATPESAAAGAECGAELLEHRSRPLNPQLLAAADDVIAMTIAHAQIIALRYPGVGAEVQLLCRDGSDLDDPIGAGMDVYRDCARTIRTHLERYIPEWIGP